MAKLSTLSIEDTPQSVCIYGAPKVGKTKLAGMLAKHFKLTWIDIENGHTTLFQLPKEWQENIELIRIPDTKDDPAAIDGVMRLLTGAKVTVCDAHGKVNCGKCATKPVGNGKEQYELATLNPKEHVVVLDSFTQLTSSAQAKSTKNLDPTKGEFEEFKHFRVQGAFLEKCLDLMQNARFNIVVIAHEAGIEQVDKSEKIMPAGGTKNFARLVSKYFGHIIHMSVKSKKHKANSSSTENSQVVAGSRTNFVIDLDNEDSISNLFKSVGSSSTPTLVKKPASLRR